jgi:hypothetical protein
MAPSAFTEARTLPPCECLGAFVCLGCAYLTLLETRAQRGY